MNIQKHGLSVGIERVNDDFFLSLKIVGKLTHKDYEQITPMLDSAVAMVEQPEIKALIDITALEGWELRAAWDDFKLGLKHGSQFTKIAIVGNKSWQNIAVKVGGWFICGELKHFESESSALSWLHE